MYTGRGGIYVTFLDFVMRGWSYNVLYVYQRITNANDDDDDDDMLI